jgi:hypothetical protein
VRVIGLLVSVVKPNENYSGGIVKLTFSALILVGLSIVALQGMPAAAQTNAGSTFQVVPTPNGNKSNSSIFAASASSATDIWAVGDSTMHFNGTKWTAFAAPLINGELTADLQGVVDISPTEAWAVGNVTLGANPGQIIEKWNGTKWNLFPNPTLLPNSQGDLFAMTSSSPTDIWAVGNLVQTLSNGVILSYNLFEHWNGTSWTPTFIQDNTFEALTGVSEDATNDAWAVGWVSPESDASNGTLAIHWNGTSWTEVATPENVGEGPNQLNAVVALTPDNAWAVGYSTPGLAGQSATLTLILHWDGTTWSIVPSPNVGPNSTSQSNRLLGITANSADDIYAFGSYFAADGSGDQMTLLLHWDGTSWTIVTSPNPTKGNFLDDLLFAGVVSSPGNVWIFGNEDEGSQGGMGTLAIHSTTAK